MNLHHDKEAFAELIIGAANELAIPTNVIEKDYYVTITLHFSVRKIFWIVRCVCASWSKESIC